MTNIDELLERNKAFARTGAKDKVPAIPFVPNMQLFVITCIELAIIRHTDCGSGFFADPELRRGFAERGFDEDALAGLPVLHPAETVARCLVRSELPPPRAPASERVSPSSGA